MSVSDGEALLDTAAFEPLDWHLARTIQRVAGCGDPWVGLAIALASRAAHEGHVCLDLSEAHRGLAEVLIQKERARAPRLEEWIERICACRAVGDGQDFRPLILQRGRLYLQRFWRFEQELARSIAARCAGPMLHDADDPALEKVLSQLFAPDAGDQCRAARLAATRRFCVISGGPGTGKTFTIGKIISMLQCLYPQRQHRILLAAPTGKAAARLQEALEGMSGETALLTEAPAAQTLHRLLGYLPSAAGFRYDSGHPLPADVVIVDEASMIDLGLMRQLMLAVPAQARLILVGDKDQLASVEAGAVLGDICHGVRRTAPEDPPASPQEAVRPDLAGHIAVLQRSYRFDAQSGIGALGTAINAGDAEKVLSLLSDPHDSSVVLKPLSGWSASGKLLEAEIAASFVPLFECRDPVAALEQLNRFKILCALRKGPYGTEALNRWVEGIMRRAGRIAPAHHGSAQWYPGRPVLITRNDYFHGLFNGDAGVVMAGAENQGRQVFFPAPAGGCKSLPPQQLPEHETVYAMTIHKSQGSEFERVMIVLPDEDLPLLTRELIYTAVTRARRSVVIWADPETLARAVERPIRRASGLREMLW